MRRTLVSVICFVSLLSSCDLLFAHHGSGVSYDLKQQITLNGTMIEFDWRNPHTFLIFDVKDSKGNVVRWGAETHTPAQLKEVGWTKDTLKPGDEVTITVFPSKMGTPRGLLSKVVLNGKVILDDGAQRTRNGDQ